MKHANRVLALLLALPTFVFAEEDNGLLTDAEEVVVETVDTAVEEAELSLEAFEEQAPEAPPTEAPAAEEGPMPVLTVFAIRPEGAAVTVRNADGEIVEPEQSGDYQLAPGEYVYDARAEGFVGVFDVPFTVTEGEEYALVEAILEEEGNGDGAETEEIPVEDIEAEAESPAEDSREPSPEEEATEAEPTAEATSSAPDGAPSPEGKAFGEPTEEPANVAFPSGEGAERSEADEVDSIEPTAQPMDEPIEVYAEAVDEAPTAEPDAVAELEELPLPEGEALLIEEEPVADAVEVIEVKEAADGGADRAGRLCGREGKCQGPGGLYGGRWRQRKQDPGSGWYAVTEDVGFSESVIITGDTNLILCDGKTLYANDGIWVQQQAKLTIWAQSTGYRMGKLNAIARDGDKAGIGSGQHQVAGAIVINGGNITAISQYGAGIGGGNKGMTKGDTGYTTITINGGEVTAKSEQIGAGIGSGGDDNTIGTITITGGTVDATGNTNAGIGDYNARNDVTITGGRVTAHGGAGKGGIYGRKITIGGIAEIGDYVVADGKNYAAGICGLEQIVINGSRVTATGGEDGGAGIGGGYEREKCCSITITNSTVTATGGEKGGAGIGGGYERGGSRGNLEGNVTITNSTGHGPGDGRDGDGEGHRQAHPGGLGGQHLSDHLGHGKAGQLHRDRKAGQADGDGERREDHADGFQRQQDL